MELYQLRYFQAVAEAGTLREAARRLLVSQSAVSRAVTMLEAEVGVELFTRRGRVNELNRFGIEFLRGTRAVQRDIDSAVAGVRQLAGADDGTVALGFLHSLGVHTVPHLIRRHHRGHPGARFALWQRSGRELLNDLVGGTTDVCLTYPGAFPETTAVQWHPLFTQRLYAVLPTVHRFAGRPTVEFAELLEEPFVALNRDHTLRRIFDDACARRGVTVAIAFEGTDVGTLRGLIGAGLGVGVLPKAPHLPQGTVEVLIEDTDLVRPIAVGWIAQRYLPPSAASFRDTAIALYEDPRNQAEP